jgi:ABC-type glutathione transport system ATPase component
LLLKRRDQEFQGRARYYPHQLSGGMLQRAMIAMALSLPAQAPHRRRADHGARRHHPGADPAAHQGLQAEFGMALIMITHDLGVIAETVDRVVVMYGGRVMEEGPVSEIFDAPKHSYTQQLLASLTAGESPGPSRMQARRSPLPSNCANLSKVYKLRRQGRIFASYTDHHGGSRREPHLAAQQVSSGSSASPVRARATTGMMAMRLTEPTAGQHPCRRDRHQQARQRRPEVVSPAHAGRISGQLFGTRPDDDTD